jgi:hypothetical protein
MRNSPLLVHPTVLTHNLCDYIRKFDKDIRNFEKFRIFKYGSKQKMIMFYMKDCSSGIVYFIIPVSAQTGPLFLFLTFDKNKST